MAFQFFQNKLDKHVSQAIMIVGTSDNHIQSIKERLTLKGINRFIELHKDPFTLTAEDIPSNLWAIIMDVGDISTHTEYASLIKKLFAKDVVCIVIGNNDSIRLHNEFMMEGIIYIFSGSHMDNIYEKLSGYDSIKEYNKSTNISFLGCKGGVGNSTISYHLAKLLYKRYLTPVLCVQGVHSSFSLDFLSGINFAKEHFSDNALSLYKQSKDDMTSVHNKFKKFNFIVYDHSIQSYDKDEIEVLLNEADSAVLVIDKNIASIRKAKEVIKINEFLLSVNQGASRLLVVCNETGKEIDSSLNSYNLQEIMGIGIDSYIAYHPLNSSKSYDILPTKIHKSLIELIGILVGESNVKKKVFAKFLRK